MPDIIWEELPLFDYPPTHEPVPLGALLIPVVITGVYRLELDDDRDKDRATIRKQQNAAAKLQIDGPSVSQMMSTVRQLAEFRAARQVRQACTFLIKPDVEIAGPARFADDDMTPERFLDILRFKPYRPIGGGR